MTLKIDRRTNFGFTLWQEPDFSNWAQPSRTRTALVEQRVGKRPMGWVDMFGNETRCRITIHERLVIIHQWTDEPTFRWEGREYEANGR